MTDTTMLAAPGWSIAVDTGGTFTDCIARDPAGRIHRAKVLSSSALRADVRWVDPRAAVGRGDESESTGEAVSGATAELGTVVAVQLVAPWADDAGVAATVGMSVARPGGPVLGRVVGLRASSSFGSSADDGTGPVATVLVRLEEAGAGADAVASAGAGAPGDAAPADAVDALGPGSIELRSTEPAPVLAARVVTGTPAAAALPACSLRLATTRGTNALLERRVAPTGVLLTRGFLDLPVIGDQRRPDLFARAIERPSPLHRCAIEVDERRDATGAVVRPLDEDAVRAAAATFRAAGVTAVAVCFLHATIDASHEERAADLLRAAGIPVVVCSAYTTTRRRIVPRITTATVDACLDAELSDYVRTVAATVGAGLRVLTSAGGLRAADAMRPTDGLLSGPAGGVEGAAAAARRAGLDAVVGFDMGGTSTDVCRVAGTPDRTDRHAVGDVTVLAPSLAIETVAAGGGSVCTWRDGRLRVGPESAGAHPGPACYGAGGPLTITDVNLLLGRLDPERFAFAPDRGAAERALAALRASIPAPVPSDDELCAGLLEIAAETMADAIRRITVREGWDPAVHAMVGFGGAGGQHALAVADRLAMDTVLLPADASLLSAVGLMEARPAATARVETLITIGEWTVPAGDAGAAGAADAVSTTRDDAGARLGALLAATTGDLVERLRADGVAAERLVVTDTIAAVRAVGQDATVSVPLPAAWRGRATAVAGRTPAREAEAESKADADALVGAVRAGFAEISERIFGHAPADRDLEIAAVEVTVAEDAVLTAAVPDPVADAPAVPSGHRRMHDGDAWTEVPWYDRAELAPGATVDGPALVVEARSVLVIERGWSARVRDDRAVLARRGAGSRGAVGGRGPRAADAADGDGPDGADAAVAADAVIASEADAAATDPIARELTIRRLAAIATEMGEQLQRTAISTNVRERLDFSCAVLDGSGRLLANAPHVPVHLGALGPCVRAVLEAIPIDPGDVVLTNHPAFGGSHLPDITVITPVDQGGRRVGYVASRAHHAEVGGMRPGSMPPAARTLAEEGVVLPPMHVVRRGQDVMSEVVDRLTRGPWPSRAPAENVADLRAQIAAGRRGAARFAELVAARGHDVVAAHTEALLELGRASVTAALAPYAGTTRTAHDVLDDGTPIAVSITVPDVAAVPEVPGGAGARDTPSVRVDFTGSGPVHPGNLNATPAIVSSALMYVLRLLVGRPVPLNDGMLAGIDLRLPASLLAPTFVADGNACPAVVGGNVETSQRVVDVLLRAFDVMACGQGTMNNLVFGDDAFGYYETIGGGAGAGPTFDGASGVHVHMTNTALTDPEVLEARYPVVLERFALRTASGGAGRHRGGDGLERVLRFTRPVRVSLLTQRRLVAPPGAHGGADGAAGEQWVERAAGGGRDAVPGIAAIDAEAGDRLILRTPGGGGWGDGPGDGAGD